PMGLEAVCIGVFDFWRRPGRNEGAFYLAAARRRAIRFRIRRIHRTKITSRLVRVYLKRTERKFDRGKVSGTTVRIDPMLRGDFNVATIHRFARLALRRVAPTESRSLCVDLIENPSNVFFFTTKIDTYVIEDGFCAFGQRSH